MDTSFSIFLISKLYFSFCIFNSSLNSSLLFINFICSTFCSKIISFDSVSFDRFIFEAFIFSISLLTTEINLFLTSLKSFSSILFKFKVSSCFFISNSDISLSLFKLSSFDSLFFFDFSLSLRYSLIYLISFSINASLISKFKDCFLITSNNSVLSISNLFDFSVRIFFFKIN